MNTAQKESNDFERSLKSRETEEPIDMWFYRPVGYQMARMFNRLGFTPNAVTWIGIVLGVIAGVCFYYQDLYINLLGMFLLVWANLHDSADGQLARMTGIKTTLGRLLDGLCGDIWFIVIYTAIAIRLTPEWGIYIYLLGAAAGYCHAKQASMGDYYRNLHLYFLKGEKGSEFETSAQVKETYNTYTFGRALIYKLFFFFYHAYTKGQERWSPALQTMLTAMRKHYPSRQLPTALRDEFLVQSRPLVKYTNILSFNIRVIVLFVTLLFGMPWIYFVFELTAMNLIMIYMLYQYRLICNRLTQRIGKNENAEI